jgi:uncharacterized protein (UPF0276 family)
MELPGSTWPEAAFLRELTKRTGCGLLFDVNNLFISAHNLHVDIASYLWDVPFDAIGEFHVAGHSRRELQADDGDIDVLLIDDHGSAVPEAVWHVLETMLALTGTRPVLVEWDNQIPALADLLAEGIKAQAVLNAFAAQTGRQSDHVA